MQILENVSLAGYSTMRLGGVARYLVEVVNEGELLLAIDYARENSLKIHVAGGGSNTIFDDGTFNKLFIVNKIPGIKESVDGDSTVVTVGSGVPWDEVVSRSVELGYSDIAALSMIPGTTGGAPVQNIGAYGQQISDSIISVRALDKTTNTFVEILAEDCEFSYRHSRFNTDDKGKYIITSVKLRISRKTVEPFFYKDIEQYFSEHNISVDQVLPKDLRDAVTKIRSIKLPDPSKVASCGSFFKNPVVSHAVFQDLSSKYPGLKSNQTDDGNLKLYAGQLIELCNMKDYHDPSTGMSTWKNQALVVVNESAKTTADLLEFKRKIVSTVYAQFGIELVQEPEIVSSIDT